MDMRTKDHRTYTNQLPRWAIGFHIGFISLFFILGIGFLVFAIRGVLNGGMGLFLFFLLISILLLFLAWISYVNLQVYLKFFINIQVGDDGYHYSVRSKEVNRESHIFLPYEKMKFVLIGIEYNTMYEPDPVHDRTNTILLRAAKVMIYGESAENQLEVLSFTHSEQSSLHVWIQTFQEHGVNIFHTDQALTEIPHTPEAVESVPKEPYEGTLSFVIGSRAKEEDHVFLTEEQQQIEEEKIKKRRRKGHYVPYFIAVLQILIICFWFPTFPISAGQYSDDSGSIYVILTTFVILFITYAYMKRVKWYEPLRDAFIIFIGIFIGSYLTPDDRSAFPSAIQNYASLTVGWILTLYYGAKLISWIKKKRKQRRVQPKQQKNEAI